ncbi:MAG: hypothetical protein JW913_00215 [Chitinispirillaceae bacterium]|nr:hypothetical protein [Chitinispirillaceae bacterium]
MNTRWLAAWCLGLVIILIICWTTDIGLCASRHLYFSSEIGTLLLALAVYVTAFHGVRWNDPAEPGDDSPQQGWKRFSRELVSFFLLLGAVMAIAWVSLGIAGGLSTIAWFKRAIWMGYMLGVYAICIVLVVRYFKYIRALPLVVATAIMVYFLSTYEIILLDRGIGWCYNNTVIGYIFGIPLDNVLFVYPVSPALAMIMYAVVTRRLNDLKAFWLLNLILAPVSVVFELIAVYPLDIWRVMTTQSILPMGKTCIEEFLFYYIMSFFSISLYAFLCRNMKKKLIR